MAHAARKSAFVATLSEYREHIGPWTFDVCVPAEIETATGEVVYRAETLRRVSMAIARELSMRGAQDGAAFRYMRKASGLQAKELSDLLGVSPETLSRWENGKQPIERRAIAVIGSIALDAESGNTTTIDRLRGLREAAREPGRIIRVDLSG